MSPNMHEPMGIGPMDVIVLAVCAFTVVFVLAWLASPALRHWLEQPKYRFEENVKNYDRAK